MVRLMSNSVEEIGDVIHRALTYGIKLPKMSKQEADDYLLSLSDYINKGNMFRGVYNENGITIETKFMEPILMVRIRKDTLEFMPVSETSFFDSFMSVIEYISVKKKEEDIMREFKIFVDEVDKDLLSDEIEEEPKKVEPEKDDFDWI
jgi:hypothetical protein